MRPVRTHTSNVKYVGRGDVGDLHGTRLQPGIVVIVWELEPAERALIAQGMNLALTIFNEPLPPVSLSLTPEVERDEDAAAYRILSSGSDESSS